MANCTDCNRYFHQPEDESWRVRCVACYVRMKARRAELRETAPVVDDQLRRELCENMRGLLQLTHPDKHGGSEAATKVTQWLLDVRSRIATR